MSIFRQKQRFALCDILHLEFDQVKGYRLDREVIECEACSVIYTTSNMRKLLSAVLIEVFTARLLAV